MIFAQHEAFAAATGDPAWQRVTAVREHRVYAAPAMPFGFVEEPPSVNRLIGLPWLGSLLYPDDLRSPIRARRIGAFYTLFYRRAPSADRAHGAAARRAAEVSAIAVPDRTGAGWCPAHAAVGAGQAPVAAERRLTARRLHR